MTRLAFTHFAIFAAMRTGSNLLERLMNQYDGLTCHGELFNPHFIGTSGQETAFGLSMTDRDRDPQLLITKAQDATEGLAGFRIFDGHDPRIEDRVLADPTCAKIILRRNPIDSYVSLEIARQTDQWILGNAVSRKTARIRFEAGAYQRFLDERNGFYGRIDRAIRSNGQVPFELRYEELKDPDILNGLAAWLGIDDRRMSFREPIKRQNPEPLAEKVVNFDDMAAYLAGSTEAHTGPSRSTVSASSKDFLISRSQPVLVAPVPGTARKPLVDWLRAISGLDAFDRGLSPGQMSRWLDEAKGLIALSMVEHPLSRAYRVFQRRIVAGKQAYPVIREKLAQSYDVPLQTGNETPEDQARAFEAFLAFLGPNLERQTGLRVDPDWALQSDYIAAVSETVPLSHVIRSNDLPLAANALCAQLGVPAADVTSASHGGGPPLDEILSDRMIALARTAYGPDYRAFGFADRP